MVIGPAEESEEPDTCAAMDLCDRRGDDGRRRDRVPDARCTSTHAAGPPPVTGIPAQQASGDTSASATEPVLAHRPRPARTGRLIGWDALSGIDPLRRIRENC